MAIQTKIVAIVPWDANLVAQVGYTYDDVDLRIRSVFADNPAPRGLQVIAERTDGSRRYSVVVPTNNPVGTPTTVVIQTNAANRLQLRLDSRGRLDDVQFTVGWVEV